MIVIQLLVASNVAYSSYLSDTHLYLLYNKVAFRVYPSFVCLSANSLLNHKTDFDVVFTIIMRIFFAVQMCILLLIIPRDNGIKADVLARIHYYIILTKYADHVPIRMCRYCFSRINTEKIYTKWLFIVAI